VDFPEPFGPRKPKTLPRGTSNETWSTATNVPNFRVRFSHLRKDEDDDEDEDEDEAFCDGEEGDRDEDEEGDFSEGEWGSGEGGAGRAGWSLMQPPHLLQPFLPALRAR
jgi:hypothetical protein